MPSESLRRAGISQPVRDATGKAFSRADRLKQLQRRAAKNPDDMDARAEYVMVQRGVSPSATSLANLDVEKESAAPIDIKGAAPASSSVVKLPEGSTVVTKGAVTAYRPKGDPYRYTYNADTKAFSVYNLDGTPVRENVTQGMSGYEDFLAHAGGGRTKYFSGAATPKAESAPTPKTEEPSPAPKAEEPASGTVVADKPATLEAEAGDTSPPVDAPTGEDASSPAKYNRGVATSPQKPEASGERPKISLKSGVPRKERLGEIGTLAGADFRVGIGPYLESILGSSDPEVLAGYIRPDRSVNLLEVGDALRREEFTLEDWNFLEKVLKNAGLIAYDAPPTERRQLAAASAQRRGLSPLSQRDLTDIGR